MVLALLNDIETNPRPTKSCPICISDVPIRKNVCECSHVFKRQKPSPMKLQQDKRILTAQERSCESLVEVNTRKQADRIAKNGRRGLGN